MFIIIIVIIPNNVIVCLTKTFYLFVDENLFFPLRAKYHKLKYGTELNQGEMKMPSFESGWLFPSPSSLCSCCYQLDFVALYFSFSF